MKIINECPEVKQVVNELRNIASMIESGDAEIYKSVISDCRRYNESRQIELEITVAIMEKQA